MRSLDLLSPLGYNTVYWVILSPSCCTSSGCWTFRLRSTDCKHACSYIDLRLGVGHKLHPSIAHAQCYLFLTHVNRRWVRLLLSREFSLPETLIIWDALFAEGKRHHRPRPRWLTLEAGLRHGADRLPLRGPARLHQGLRYVASLLWSSPGFGLRILLTFSLSLSLCQSPA